MRRFLLALTALALVAIGLFSYANSDLVEVRILPGGASITAPLFAVMAACAAIGCLLGGVLSWNAGRGARRSAQQAQRRVRELERAARSARNSDRQDRKPPESRSQPGF